VNVRSVNPLGNRDNVVNGEIDLDPLGTGEERQVEIDLAPQRAKQVNLVFHARYDDDEQQGVTHSYSFQINFVQAPSAYTPIEQNPYIVGMPVKSREMFFGRQNIFNWVRENISGQYQEQPLLLYGERRMGKTSILYQLQQNPPTPNHICLLFDLQLYSYIIDIGEFLFEMASNIIMRLQEEGLDIEGIGLEEPNWKDYDDGPYRVFRGFCDALDRCLGETRIVIMLDEFGVLMSKVKEGVFDGSIFDYLRGITQRSNRFTFLFTGAYEVRRMQQDFDSILFNMPRVHKVSYLTEAEAVRLIEEPLDDLLVYHPLVVQKIIRITACHPYFTQYICAELVNFARKAQVNLIQLHDLDLVVRDVLQDATGNIENSIYNYLGDGEKLVLAALANVTDDVRLFVPLHDIVSVLERRHLSVPREEIMQATNALIERDLITEMRIGQQLRYAFRMGLVRMWLRQNEMLLRLAEEREI
jgi:hypothetical protein